MLPCSSRQTVRYVPKDGRDRESPPTYLIGIPTEWGKNELRVACIAEGILLVTLEQLREGLKDAIAEVLPEAERAAALALVDEVAALPPEALLAAPSAKALAKIERLCLTRSPAYATLSAEQQRWWPAYQWLAAKQFLRGWENVSHEGRPVAFTLHQGLASDESLAALPEAHVYEIGSEALALSRVSDQEKKDSASPST